MLTLQVRSVVPSHVINERTAELRMIDGSRATPEERGSLVRLVQGAGQVGNMKVGRFCPRRTGSDQADEGELAALQDTRLRQLRKEYEVACGGLPRERDGFFAEQPAALSGQLATDTASRTDFAVFGPFGGRQAQIPSPSK